MRNDVSVETGKIFIFWISCPEFKNNSFLVIKMKLVNKSWIFGSQIPAVLRIHLST